MASLCRGQIKNAPIAPATKIAYIMIMIIWIWVFAVNTIQSVRKSANGKRYNHYQIILLLLLHDIKS